jgi:hypothetical protein
MASLNVIQPSPMSALGQKRTLTHLRPMSALPPKADMDQHGRDVCFVPKADISQRNTRSEKSNQLLATPVGTRHRRAAIYGLADLGLQSDCGDVCTFLKAQKYSNQSSTLSPHQAV